MQVGIEAAWVPGSEALRTFYHEPDRTLSACQVREGDCCCARRHKPRPCSGPSRPDFARRPIRSSTVSRISAISVASSIFKARLHFWLHSWLGAHVALSVALTLLMLIHAVLALKYL